MDTLSNRAFNQNGWRRWLKKSAALVVALALLFVSAGRAQIVHAASLIVTTTDDELNADGDCSLREAMTAANTNTAVDACEAGIAAPGVDIINFSVTGIITLGSTLPVIGGVYGLPPEEVTIDGPGADSLTISGAGAFRVFLVSVFGVLNLEGVTVANGSASNGGGIDNAGSLTVTNSTFSGNSASSHGGAIFNNNGPLTITNTTFSGNSANDGGAINNYKGPVMITRSNFSGNSASSGGGIYSYSGSITITDSTFFLNTAGSGGGIYNYVNLLSVTSTTFSGNSASSGGGIFHSGGGPAATITNSTFSQNSASGDGGGILNTVATTVKNSTFYGNLAAYGGAFASYSSLTLQNSIIVNSTMQNCVGITDGGGNLQYPGEYCGVTISSADPLLDPAGLQNNGGFTQTIAIQTGSPAVDHAWSENCPATDQRGVTRPQGAGCDIGAYELEQMPTDTTAPTIVITTPADDATYLLGQVVLADYACQDEAGGSGLASCVGTVPVGSAIDTASVGTKTFTVNAADNAGNTSSASVSYNVIYNFSGFFSPVDNPPIVNTAKAGQTIALKWRITDFNGVPVTNLTSVTVTAVSLSCDLGATADQIEEYASGTSGLQNLGDGYYQFNWKTPKGYANSCKTLKLSLGEGSSVAHDVLFRFTR